MRLMILPVFSLFAAGLAYSADEKLSKDEKQIVELVNKERVKQGLKELTIDPLLCKSARGHSQNMARTGIYEHEIDGKMAGARTTDAGYKWEVCGENIGRSEAKVFVPANMMKVWMDSKLHRENILHKEFTQVGIAIARAENGKWYITQVFAAPK